MRRPGKPRHELKVADEVWLATALLHREHPDRADFTVAEIVERARQEGLTPFIERLRRDVNAAASRIKESP